MTRRHTRTGQAGQAGHAGRAGQAGVEAQRLVRETDSLFVNDEAQQRRELRLLRLLSSRWTQLSLASSQLVNKKAAESRIRDANIAEESANLTRYNILSQSGIAALAQANSTSASVLALLR